MEYIINLGTLYLDGKALSPNANPPIKKGQAIQLRDGQPDTAIPWLCRGKTLIATKPLCHNITWNELNASNFITGAVVTISGLAFSCRIPRIYRDKSEPEGMRTAQIWDVRPEEDETELLIARVAAGCEAPPTVRDIFWTRVINRQGMAARDSSWIDEHQRVKFCGQFKPKSGMAWVPVLEPLNTADPSECVSQTMVFLMPGLVLHGKLIDATNYDLLVRPTQNIANELNIKHRQARGDWWEWVDEHTISLDKAKLIHCTKI